MVQTIQRIKALGNAPATGGKAEGSSMAKRFQKMSLKINMAKIKSTTKRLSSKIKRKPTNKHHADVQNGNIENDEEYDSEEDRRTPLQQVQIEFDEDKDDSNENEEEADQLENVQNNQNATEGEFYDHSQPDFEVRVWQRPGL